jgi:DNA modification methylase
MNIDTIICGDNATVLTAFPDECIDLTVTSPPYDNLRTYNGFTWSFEALAGQLYRVTKPGGVVVWVVGDATIDGSETLTSFNHALYFKSLGFCVETMIYEVAGTGAKGSNKYYWQSFEYMFVLSKGAPKTSNLIRDKKNIKTGIRHDSSPKNDAIGTRQNRKGIVIKEFGIRQNIWRYHAGMNGDDKTEHPAPFPNNLARDHILSWSNPGDVVLDPFVGSGTTPKMAKETGRHWIGIDISDEYCRLANRRVSGANVPLPFFAEALP